MAVSVNSVPIQPKKDPLDTIVKGLQIAGSIYGIREASAKLDQIEAANTAKEEARTGVTTPAERLKLKQAGFSEVAEGTPGAQTLITSEDPSQKVYVSPPTSKDNLITPYQSEQLKIDREKMVQNAQLEREKLASAANKTKEEKAPKPNQFQAATFGRRLEAADSVMTDLASQGFDRTGAIASAQSLGPNSIQSDELQQQEQAERNFVNALLRRESGSAIAKSEFTSAEKQYFPRYGDSEKVLAQKAQNRAIVKQGLMAEAGNAWDDVPQIAVIPTVPKQDNSGQAIAGTRSNPKQVIQGGHTYILNEKTGKYE